jgi:hypothetical protein
MKLIFSLKQFALFIMQMVALFTYQAKVFILQNGLLSMLLLSLLLLSIIINIFFAMKAKAHHKSPFSQKNNELSYNHFSKYPTNFYH